MAQNDDQKNQGEGYPDQGSDESLREGRSESTPSESEEQTPVTPQDQGSDLDDADELDEDRDDDDRIDGGANRRNSIG